MQQISMSTTPDAKRSKRAASKKAFMLSFELLHRPVPKMMFQATNTTLPPQQQRADPLVRISWSSWILPAYAPITKSAQIPTIGAITRGSSASSPRSGTTTTTTTTTSTPVLLANACDGSRSFCSEPLLLDSPHLRCTACAARNPSNYNNNRTPPCNNHFVSFIVVNALPWSTSVPPPRSPPCSRRSSRARAPPRDD